MRIGDIVRVTDAGWCYSTYFMFFRENNISIDIASRYRYGHSICFEPSNMLYRVLGCYRNRFDNQDIAVIEVYREDGCKHGVFLVGVDGLELVEENENDE